MPITFDIINKYLCICNATTYNVLCKLQIFHILHPYLYFHMYNHLSIPCLVDISFCISVWSFSYFTFGSHIFFFYTYVHKYSLLGNHICSCKCIWSIRWITNIYHLADILVPYIYDHLHILCRHICIFSFMSVIWNCTTHVYIPSVNAYEVVIFVLSHMHTYTHKTYISTCMLKHKHADVCMCIISIVIGINEKRKQLCLPSKKYMSS